MGEASTAARWQGNKQKQNKVSTMLEHHEMGAGSTVCALAIQLPTAHAAAWVGATALCATAQVSQLGRGPAAAGVLDGNVV